MTTKRIIHTEYIYSRQLKIYRITQKRGTC